MAIYHLKHSNLRQRAFPYSKNDKTLFYFRKYFIHSELIQTMQTHRETTFLFFYSFSQERVLILISVQSKLPIWQNLHSQNELYWKTSSCMPVAKSSVRLPLCSFIQIFSKGKRGKITTWDKRCIMLYWILEKKPIQVDSKALGQKPIE